jgi:hypothetical protein
LPNGWLRAAVQKSNGAGGGSPILGVIGRYMNRQFATQSSEAIQRALKELHSVVMAMQHLEFPEKIEYEKSLGILIGQMQVKLLEPIIVHYPDLDDLKDVR